MKNTKLIDQYLRGELSSAERIQVEQQLKGDAAFKSEFDLQQGLEQKISRAALIATVGAAHARNVGGVGGASGSSWMGMKGFLIATAIVVSSVAGYFAWSALSEHPEVARGIQEEIPIENNEVEPVAEATIVVESDTSSFEQSTQPGDTFAPSDSVAIFEYVSVKEEPEEELDEESIANSESENTTESREDVKAANVVKVLDKPVLELDHPETPLMDFVVDGNKGGTMTYGRSGTVIRYQKGSFLDENGKPVKGKVKVGYREFRDAADIALSHLPMTYKDKNMNSAGMFEFVDATSGRNLSINPEKPVEIDFKMTKTGEGIGFYRLNEETGKWGLVKDLKSREASSQDLFTEVASDEDVRDGRPRTDSPSGQKAGPRKFEMIKNIDTVDQYKRALNYMIDLGENAAFMEEEEPTDESTFEERFKNMAYVGTKRMDPMGWSGFKGKSKGVLRDDFAVNVDVTRRAWYMPRKYVAISMSPGGAKEAVPEVEILDEVKFFTSEWGYAGQVEKLRDLEIFEKAGKTYLVMKKYREMDTVAVSVWTPKERDVVKVDGGSEIEAPGWNDPVLMYNDSRTLRMEKFVQVQDSIRKKKNADWRAYQDEQQELVKYGIKDIHNMLDLAKTPAEMNMSNEQFEDYARGNRILMNRLKNELAKVEESEVNGEAVMKQLVEKFNKEQIALAERLNQPDVFKTKGWQDPGHTFPNIIQKLRVSGFGVYNCDQVYRIANRQNVKGSYQLADGTILTDLQVLSLIDKKVNGAFSFDPHRFTWNKMSDNVLVIFGRNSEIYIAHPRSKRERLDNLGTILFTVEDVTEKVKSSKDLRMILAKDGMLSMAD